MRCGASPSVLEVHSDVFVCEQTGGASSESRQLAQLAGRRELGVAAIWLIPLLAGDFDFDLGEIFEKNRWIASDLGRIWIRFGGRRCVLERAAQGNGWDPYSLPCDRS